MNNTDDKIIQESPEPDILDDLDDLDKAIIRLKINGHKDTEIAAKLEKHRQTIAGRLKKIKVQQAIQELQKTALQILLEGQTVAARRLRKIVENGSDADATRAAKEILKGVLSESIMFKDDVDYAEQLKRIEELQKEFGQ